MTTTVTKDQLETLSSNDNGQAVSETKKYTGEFEGKFIGTLVGNATTAKQLEQPYNFSLAGDAEGTVAVNASSVVLNTTVNHATEADTADFAGKTNLAARATLADMANTAEFAYRAGRFARVVINLTGAVIGSGEATNSETVDVKITDIDASNLFVVGSLATNPDTKKVYVDVTGRHFWIFDTVNSKWVDCFKTLADELDAHGLRLDALEALNAGDRLTALEGRADTLETTTADHEARITANKTAIDNHELRLNNIETSTDVGQFATRIQAVEDKNIEQDKSIKANTDSIAVNTKAVADETKARQEADTALSTSVQNEIQPKIDTLTSGLSQEVIDRTKAISDLKTSLSSDYVTLKTAQDITAVKTIVLPSNQHAIKVKDTGTANSDTLSATVWQSIAIALDKNDKERGCLQATLGADGFSRTKLMAIQQNAKGVNLYNTLELGIKADGTQTSKIGASPASNSNDTSIATTAWVKSKMLDFIYPIGSIYMSVNNVSPQTFLGGTWVALQDRFLIGAGHSYAVNATGGATTHTLSVNEMPSHSHTFAGSSIGNHNHLFWNKNNLRHASYQPAYYSQSFALSETSTSGSGDESNESRVAEITSATGASGVSGSIAASGGNQAHSIMNPYLAVYMWKRTA